MRLDVKAFAIASAAAGMLLYAFGALLDRLSAWGGAAVVSFIFRVDVAQLAQPFTFGTLLIGLGACGLLGGGMGAIVGWGYNLLTRTATAPGGAPAARPVAGNAS